MVEMVACVLKHRLAPGGRALLCCAVREQVRWREVGEVPCCAWPAVHLPVQAGEQAGRRARVLLRWSWFAWLC